jgi:hypothetical protein
VNACGTLHMLARKERAAAETCAAAGAVDAALSLTT